VSHDGKHLASTGSDGTAARAFVAIEDWYVTFCGLAGVDPTDARAAAAGLPPVDGIDLWPVLSGANKTSGRRLQFLGSTDNTPDKGNTIVQGVIRAVDGYKLILGDANPSFWQGPTYPNSSAAGNFTHLACGDPDAGGAAYGPGCLFNILSDPYETNDLAATYPHIVAELRKRGVMLAMMDGRIRACTHLDVTAEMIEEAVGHVRDIVRAA
jgi:arylsulfatase I/J